MVMKLARAILAPIELSHSIVILPRSYSRRRRTRDWNSILDERVETASRFGHLPSPAAVQPRRVRRLRGSCRPGARQSRISAVRALGRDDEGGVARRSEARDQTNAWRGGLCFLEGNLAGMVRSAPSPGLSPQERGRDVSDAGGELRPSCSRILEPFRGRSRAARGWGRRPQPRTKRARPACPGPHRDRFISHGDSAIGCRLRHRLMPNRLRRRCASPPSHDGRTDRTAGASPARPCHHRPACRRSARSA